MAWTYTANPSGDNRDAVRVLVGDTDKNRQLASDEEIDFFLAEEGNKYLAAAATARAISSGPPVIRTFGDLSIDTLDRSHFMDLAKTLMQRGNVNQVPTAGGISVAEKLTHEANTDFPVPSFKEGMQRNV